jgi:hypothetical protein
LRTRERPRLMAGALAVQIASDTQVLALLARME